MNYLAHIYLTPNHDELLIGNFINDGIRGKEKFNFSPAVQQGIKLHQLIDSYTDNHPINKMVRKRMHQHQGKFAGVALDLFYDYFLAIHWESYSSTPLMEFSLQFYQFVATYESIFPERVLLMFHSMQKHNWLYHYSTIEGLNKSLTGLSRRTNYASNLENATQFMQENFSFFESNFLQFFPDLVRYVTEQKTRISL